MSMGFTKADKTTALSHIAVEGDGEGVSERVMFAVTLAASRLGLAWVGKLLSL